MPEPTPDQTLHLPSLVIKNFRGIDELTIPRLGRVTLLAGEERRGQDDGAGRGAKRTRPTAVAQRYSRRNTARAVRKSDAFTGIEDGHRGVMT